ncbi:MAG: hemN 2 [Burkholderiaceae bacterium]|nr:hemN 2 [Burkholderiaceae bacterium]
MSMSISPQLIHKYNVAGPRYTSYPTVPYWQEADFSVAPYLETVARTFNATNARDGISLYIHLPYCESLCTFCACNHRITKKHEVEAGYIAAVLKEWRMYVDLLAQSSNERIKIREIHLGGGTPTFFAPEKLTDLINGLFEFAERADHHEFSFEGHPNNTTEAHLQTLYDLGFRRVSFGVQDYDAKVQKAINRIQPYENVARVTETARAIGYTSISHDLVFGLPHQNLDTMRHTIATTARLAPDRLAFYSYAHVPWIKGNGQRGFNDEDLPSGPEKRALYELGKEMFDELGYVEVGMDHFARPNDTLYQAMNEGRLHRNFMGYTETNTRLMLSLGVSSISDSWYAFAQNEKVLENYLARVGANELPLTRGHLLTAEDLIIRQHILNIMCRMHTDWSDPAMQFAQLPQAVELLKPMQDDGLLEILPNGLKVTEQGRPFVRNIAMAFDVRLWAKQPETRLFSMTI